MTVRRRRQVIRCTLGVTTVAGRVVDDRTGEPIAKARVKLESDERWTVLETEKDGRFEFPRVAPGRYWLRAHAGRLVVPPIGIGVGSEPDTMEIGDIRLESGAGIDWIFLRTFDGRPRPGARLLYERGDGELRRFFRIEKGQRRDIFFENAVFPPGKLTLVLELAGDRRETATVALRAGEQRSCLVLELHDGPERLQVARFDEETCAGMIREHALSPPREEDAARRGIKKLIEDLGR